MNPYNLSDQQWRLMRIIIAEHRTTRQEMADAMGLSQGTIRTMLDGIYRKMDAKNLTHAVLLFQAQRRRWNKARR